MRKSKKNYNWKDYLLAFGPILLLSIFVNMTPDARLEKNHQSYFKNDVQEDMVVELFTQNKPIQTGTTKNTKLISYTTDENMSECSSKELINLIENYVNNVGGEIVYLNTFVNYKSYPFYYGYYYFSNRKKVIVRVISAKVPEDAPFVNGFEKTLEKFFANRDYTLKRYNGRHGLER